MKKLGIIVLFASMAVPALCQAQSRSFKLGKWVEIQSSILKELNRSYVDSLPVDRIQRAGIDAMLGNLDPYTVYVPEEDDEDFEMMIAKTYGGIGAVINKENADADVIIDEPYADSPASKAGLCCGDRIIAIDGKPVKGLVAKECTDRMKGQPGTKVVFTVRKLRGGQTVDVEVVREKIHIPDMEYSTVFDDKTGYILLSGFTDGLAAQVRDTVIAMKKRGMKKLVLDLRSNGGGLLNEAVDIVSIFVPKGSVVVTAKGREAMSNFTYRTGTDPVDLKMPLTVLVNSGSASSSEIVAGALQDLDRAVIMGERTFGKGLVQSVRPLPYGGKIKVTTSKYYTPSGRCVQAIDYSHRKEDGSVGHIPDSLTHEFKTASGRTVRDGGGITPDVEIKSTEYSRITFSLVYNLIINKFALDFVSRHETVAAPSVFKLPDEEFENFVKFAEGKEFDYRSDSKAIFDDLLEELDRDGLKEKLKPQLDALGSGLEISKEQYIRMKKDEIVPLLEEQIIRRYYFQRAGVELRIRYDRQLAKALEQ